MGRSTPPNSKDMSYLRAEHSEYATLARATTSTLYYDTENGAKGVRRFKQDIIPSLAQKVMGGGASKHCLPKISNPGKPVAATRVPYLRRVSDGEWF